jgi:two-component system OmpR family sensor kinase
VTIRLRLTLLFVALLAAVGLLRSVVVLSGFSSTLYEMARADTITKVQEVEDYLLDLDLELTKVGDSNGLELGSPDALPGAFSDDGSYLQLCDMNGKVLNRSSNLRTQALPQPTKSSVLTINLPLPHLFWSTRALLVTRPLLLVGHRQVGWIQAATPLQNNERTLANLAFFEALGWVGSGIVAFGAGLVFAGRALRPVATMTDTVRGWGAHDLDKRLEVGEPPHDEMDRLGLTFNQLFDRLERSFQAQQRFVADASHELKSPLTAIRGHLQLLQRRGAAHPEEAARWLDTALSEVDRLTRLVNEMLALASAAPSTSAMFAAIDLVGVAKDVVSQRQVLAPRVQEVEAQGPVWVHGEPDRLRQVLINLIDNAERATRESGEVVVRVATHHDRALLEVRDTGLGMAPAATQRIFDRFYRVDTARDRLQGGTGLGLSIVAAIVDAHEGTITVQSQEGAGTTFTVSLPLLTAPTGPITGESAAAPTARPRA